MHCAHFAMCASPNSLDSNRSSTRSRDSRFVWGTTCANGPHRVFTRDNILHRLLAPTEISHSSANGGGNAACRPARLWVLKENAGGPLEFVRVEFPDYSS
jgi:hypothetical protein